MIFVKLDGRLFNIDPDVLTLEERARIVRDGVFYLPSGELMPEPAQTLTRAFVSRASRLAPVTPLGLKSLEDEPGVPWLIPGLWPFGTVPALGGAPKIGKTTLVTDLVAALTEPGHRFLDYFEATSYTGLKVWVINAETNGADFEAALIAAGAPCSDPINPDDLDEFAGLGFDSVFVDHLRELGGAQILDLIDPDKYDLWYQRLVSCWECDGTDMWTPDVVIVDNVTAILLAANRGVEDTGKWYAAFRRLMDSLGIRNALMVAHTTQKGDHLIGGVEALAQPDGLWIYDNSHKFSSLPRLGGVVVPPIPIELGDDGRLHARPKSTPSGNTKAISVRVPSTLAPESPRSTATKGTAIEDALISFVYTREAAGEPPTTRELMSNIPGGADAVHAAIKRLIDPADGRLSVEPKPGRGGGFRYRIGQVPREAEEGKASM
jgi:hypothetical protein